MSGIAFRVNRGSSSEGECVVIHYGDLEIWVPWRQARRLARSIERECAAVAEEEKK